ncbi:uncharacterized protein LOC135145654 [Zophobas morio]|uniref:uncharacterized protein LOC135145654 n=1 Tax=Zophobas morio TaxID=2755281 RepID=UPI003082CAFF
MAVAESRTYDFENTVIATNHNDSLHDAQLDYYGKRLATCSSDNSIKVFDELDGIYQETACLQNHSGSVWQVSWAHPKFGSILASCSFDKSVIIWKEISFKNWSVLYIHTAHDLSVNSISWAPHEFGLCLACASADGFLSIISYADNTWNSSRWLAHKGGCNAVDWMPFGDNEISSGSSQRIASAGCDNLIKIWKFDQSNKWLSETPEFTLRGHEDWVRDIAWRPYFGLHSSSLASCGQDKKVLIWNFDSTSGQWISKYLDANPSIFWRISWSLTGCILSVTANDKISLWKENNEGKWEKINEIVQ